MQRIVKRFLLHKQRETDDQIGAVEMEEIKQDLQMVRFEVTNDLNRLREDTFRLVMHATDGITIIGDELFKNVPKQSQNAERFLKYKAVDFDICFSEGSMQNLSRKQSSSKQNYYLDRSKAQSSVESLDSPTETHSADFVSSPFSSAVYSSNNNETKESDMVKMNVNSISPVDLDIINEERDSEVVDKNNFAESVMSTINESGHI